MEKPTLRPDHVWNMLRAIEKKPKSFKQHIAVCIIEYGRSHPETNWATGVGEFNSAMTRAQQLLRVAIPASRFQPAQEAGPFVHLNGTKVFGDGKRFARWCYGRRTMSRPASAYVTGMSHPDIVALLELAREAGAESLCEEIPAAARYSISERNRFIRSHTISLREILTTRATADTYRDERDEARQAIEGMRQTLRLEMDAKIDTFRAEMERKMLPAPKPKMLETVN